MMWSRYKNIIRTCTSLKEHKQQWEWLCAGTNQMKYYVWILVCVWWKKVELMLVFIEEFEIKMNANRGQRQKNENSTCFCCCCWSRFCCCCCVFFFVLSLKKNWFWRRQFHIIHRRVYTVFMVRDGEIVVLFSTALCCSLWTSIAFYICLSHVHHRKAYAFALFYRIILWIQWNWCWFVVVNIGGGTVCVVCVFFGGKR